MTFLDDLEECLQICLSLQHFDLYRVILEHLGGTGRFTVVWLYSIYSNDATNLLRLLRHFKIRGSKKEWEIYDELGIGHMGTVTLKTISRLLTELFGEEFAEAMFDPNIESRDDLHRRINKPFANLFMWSVLTGRAEMAEFFWGQCDNPLSMALIACRVFRLTADIIQNKEFDERTAEKFTGYADSFEQLAVEMASEAYNMNSVSLESCAATRGDFVLSHSVHFL